jgi:hypothetical protein
MVKTIKISKKYASPGGALNIAQIDLSGDDGKSLLSSDLIDQTLSTMSSQYSSDYPISNLWNKNYTSFAHTLFEVAPSMTLVLLQPVPAAGVCVWNRISCCQDRLADAELELFDSAGNLIVQKVLTGDFVQNFSIFNKEPSPLAAPAISGTPVMEGPLVGGAPWGAISDFAAPTARWIWTTANMNTSALAGGASFYNTFFNASAGSVTIDVSVDEAASVFINGVPIGGTASWNTPNWKKRMTVSLAAGVHVIQINAASSGGPAGLLVAVMNSAGNVILQSDKSWVYAKL